MQLPVIGVKSLRQNSKLLRELAQLMTAGSVTNIQENTVAEFAIDNFPEEIFLELKKICGLSEDFNDYVFCVAPAELGEDRKKWNLYISGNENITGVEINLQEGTVGGNIPLGSLAEAIRDKKRQMDSMRDW